MDNLSFLSFINGINSGRVSAEDKQAKEQNLKDRAQAVKDAQESKQTAAELLAKDKQNAVDKNNTANRTQKKQLQNDKLTHDTHKVNAGFDFKGYLQGKKDDNTAVFKAPGLEQGMSAQTPEQQSAFSSKLNSISHGLVAGGAQAPETKVPHMSDETAPPPTDTNKASEAPVEAPAAPVGQSPQYNTEQPQETPQSPTEAPVQEPQNPSLVPGALLPYDYTQTPPAINPNQPEQPALVRPAEPAPEQAPEQAPGAEQAPQETPIPAPDAPPEVSQTPVDAQPVPLAPLFKPDPFKVAKEKQDNQRVYQNGVAIQQRSIQSKLADTTHRRGQDIMAQTGGYNRLAAMERTRMTITAALQRQKVGISDADYRANLSQSGATQRAGYRSAGGVGGAAMSPEKHYALLSKVRADEIKTRTSIDALTKGKPGSPAKDLNGNPVKNADGSPKLVGGTRPAVVLDELGHPIAAKSTHQGLADFAKLQKTYNEIEKDKSGMLAPVSASTLQGDQIGDYAQRLPGESEGAYHHRCEARARTAYQGITGAYDRYFDRTPGASALTTLNKFRGAGLAKPYNINTPLPPGSLLFSSHLGEGSGHIQVVGVNGSRFDQYGKNKFPLSDFDYFVPPPGVPKHHPQPQHHPQGGRGLIVTPQANQIPRDFTRE